ncbi:DUF4203 domain-containing protein [Candidatus Saccharibacteria bacterium]|nr:DUF4203 domain-containing protein [Candidatus Saccharibacteria bacterium]
MDKLKELENRIGGLELYESLIMFAIGLAVLLLGYRIKKVAFFIIWFLIGYNIMILLMPIINNAVPQIAANELWQVLLPVGGGILLGLLGFSIEKICLAGICFFLVMLITIQYFGTDIPTLAIGAILGVVAGAAATALMKPAIIIATAIAGAYAMTIAVLSVFPDIPKDIFYFPMIGGFAVIGAVFQFMTTKHVA